MKNNIEYTSKQICEFYGNSRVKLSEFYASERWVFDRIAAEVGTMGAVLDVGCACGGLGMALSEKYDLRSYTGIDINRDAISWANSNIKPAVQTEFIAGDVITLACDKQFDTVFSLSCADWNIESNKIIDTCWSMVKLGGYFIISLRLTDGQGINDITRSYQHINFSGNEANPEIANYVVFNFRDALQTMKSLLPGPELIGSYGYWGKPSSTAVTPFDKLVFAVFYLKKGMNNSVQQINTEFNLPKEIFSHMSFQQ